MAKQEGLNAMHVKVEKLRRQQIRTAQGIITLREKMTCQKMQSEASQTPRGRTMEPLPKAQKRKAKLRRHNGAAKKPSIGNSRPRHRGSFETDPSCSPPCHQRRRESLAGKCKGSLKSSAKAYRQRRATTAQRKRAKEPLPKTQKRSAIRQAPSSVRQRGACRT